MSRTANLIFFFTFVFVCGVSVAAPVALTPSTHIDISSGYGEALGNTVDVAAEGIFDFTIVDDPLAVKTTALIEVFESTGYTNLHLFNADGALLARSTSDVSNDRGMSVDLQPGTYFAAVTAWGREPDVTLGGGGLISQWEEVGFTGNSTNSLDYNISVSITSQVIPLPAAAWLFFSGLVGIGVFGRRAIVNSN